MGDELPDDHDVDERLREMATTADAFDWRLTATDLTRGAAPPAWRRWDLPVARPRRRAVLVAALATVAVVLAVVLPLPQLHLFGHRGRSAVAPPPATSVASPPATSVPSTGVATLVCPRRRAQSSTTWVPNKPQGITAPGLAPQEPPRAAIVCSYAGSNLETLVGETHVTKGLDALGSELGWLPAPPTSSCAGVGYPSSRLRAFLVGLTYLHGTEWVATAFTGGCPQTTNGSFTSNIPIGTETSEAFVSGRWEAPGLPPSCAHQGAGRLGEDAAMVPGEPTGLDICYDASPHAPGPSTLHASRTQLADLRSTLDGLPTTISMGGCQGSPGPTTTYTLLFTYLRGPATVVSVTDGCTPGIDNYSLQSSDVAPVLQLVQADIHAAG